MLQNTYGRLVPLSDILRVRPNANICYTLPRGTTKGFNRNRNSNSLYEGIKSAVFHKL